MYNYYRLITLVLNTKGGASETIEALTKEVDGQIVPKTQSESELALYKAMNTGSNPATKAIRCTLLDPDGNIIKIEEVVKDSVAES